MSKAIEEMGSNQENLNLMRLADAQAYFINRYIRLIPDDGRREDFQRELNYLIHLTYREAQVPLTQQLTDFVVTHNRPLILGKL